jgi:recombinational DNA repair protein RecT
MLYYSHGLGEAFGGYGDYFNGHEDDEAIAYLTLANLLIHEVHPHAITIAEEVSGMPGLAAPFKDGGYGFSVMSHADVEEHKKKYSKAQNSPWNTNFDEMAKKTVLKKALKYAPISTELMREVNQDESIHSQFRMEDLKDGNSIMDSPQDYIDMDAEVDSETGEIVSKEAGGDGSIG